MEPFLQGAFAIANAVADIATAIRESRPEPCARCGRPHGLDCCTIANKPYPAAGPLVIGGPQPKPGERTEESYLREEVRDLKRQGAQGNLTATRSALAAEEAAHAETCNRLNQTNRMLNQAKAANNAVEATSWRAGLHAAGWEIQDYLDETTDDGPLRVALHAIQRRIYAIPVGRSDRPDRPLWVSPDAVEIAVTEARAQARATAIEDAAQAAVTAAEDPITAYRRQDGAVARLADDAYNAAIQRLLCAVAIRALAPTQKGGEE